MGKLLNSALLFLAMYPLYHCTFSNSSDISSGIQFLRARIDGIDYYGQIEGAESTIYVPEGSNTDGVQVWREDVLGEAVYTGDFSNGETDIFPITGENGVTQDYALTIILEPSSPSGPTDIFHAAQLDEIRQELDGDYRLMNTIVLTDPFVPIGDENDAFTGTLDGNGKVIRGMKIERANKDYVGLFGMLASGEVRDLTLILDQGDAVDPSIEGTSFVGALAGKNSSLIKNVAVIGGVIKGSGDYIGGLVGHQSSSVLGRNIEESYATVEVHGSLSSEYVGGLVGINYGRIKNSYATGSVMGGSLLGGFVGYAHGTGSIEYSYATGEVTSTAVAVVGGFVGENSSNARIINSYFDAVLTEQESGIGDNLGIGTPTAYYTIDNTVRIGNDASSQAILQDNFLGDPSDLTDDWDFVHIWDWQENGQWPLLQ